MTTSDFAAVIVPHSGSALTISISPSHATENLLTVSSSRSYCSGHLRIPHASGGLPQAVRYKYWRLRCRVSTL